MISEPPREVQAELKAGEKLLWWDYVRLKDADNARSSVRASVVRWVIGLSVFALGMKLGFDFLGVLFHAGGPRKLLWPNADEGPDHLWEGSDPGGPYIYLALLTTFCIVVSIVAVRLVMSRILAPRSPDRNWKNCAAITENRLIMLDQSLETTVNSYPLDTIRNLWITPRPDGGGGVHFQCPGARVLSGEVSFWMNDRDDPDFRSPEEKNRSLWFQTASAQEVYGLLGGDNVPSLTVTRGPTDPTPGMLDALGKGSPVMAFLLGWFLKRIGWSSSDPRQRGGPQVDA